MREERRRSKNVSAVQMLTADGHATPAQLKQPHILSLLLSAIVLLVTVQQVYEKMNAEEAAVSERLKKLIAQNEEDCERIEQRSAALSAELAALQAALPQQLKQQQDEIDRIEKEIKEVRLKHGE